MTRTGSAAAGAVDRRHRVAAWTRRPTSTSRLSTTGAIDTVPSGVATSAFRVVQEALTNARRHAGPNATIDVRVERTDDRLDVCVEDDGRGASADHEQLGYGLIGMGERVAAFGGTLRSGPRRSGGWQVRGELPALTLRSPATQAVAGRSLAGARSLASARCFVIRVAPGRRPGDDPPGAADDPRCRAGADDRRRGGRRRRSGRPRAGGQAGRRADGRAHAEAGRHRRLRADLRRGRPAAGADAHDVRPRGLRVRRACAPAPAASCSRTRPPINSSRRSRSSPVATPSWRRRSPACSSRRSPSGRPSTAPPTRGSSALTDRESEVLRLMSRGRSNAEIAADLYLGEATVKTYVGRVLAKLGARIGCRRS